VLNGGLRGLRSPSEIGVFCAQLHVSRRLSRTTLGKSFGDQKRDPALESKTCEEVARRLWLIVLSERQESLVVSREHRAIIQAHEVGKENML
jgi:hypothetical protein